MAAKDGNPGQENPREIGQHRLPEAPDSSNADPKPTVPTPRRRSGGNPREDTRLPSDPAPSSTNELASDPSGEDALEDAPSGEMKRMKARRGRETFSAKKG